MTMTGLKEDTRLCITNRASQRNTINSHIGDPMPSGQANDNEGEGGVAYIWISGTLSSTQFFL